ncbi:MAG: hypothetical protein ABL971_13705 [Vicinamibacterales bacterium]
MICTHSFPFAIRRPATFAWRGACLALVTFALAATSRPVSAALGDSFVEVPGVQGSWPSGPYKSWIRLTGRYWIGATPRNTTTLGVGDPLVAGPPAPMPGKPNKLVVSVDKRSPELARLMQLCTSQTAVPEMRVAEPRQSGTYVPRKVANFPDFWEYKLKDVQWSACDKGVAESAEQAFVLTFRDIEWLNYDSKGPQVVKLTSTAAEIPAVYPAPPSPRTKTFLVTWFGWATLGDDATCPDMNSKAPQEDYYALLSPEEAAAERTRRGEKTVSYGNSQDRPFMDARGPHRLNVCALPGIVKTPVQHEPRTNIALGVNLDGHDGTGEPAAGTCKHENFLTPDGKLSGVDNQLYRVYGCIPGYRGKKGYLSQTHNARRADGNVVTLIEISGIDDATNDDHVELGIFYAQDRAVRGPSGAFIPNYTFRVSDDPNFAKYNQRHTAKIRDGYIVTPPIKLWKFNNGQGGIVELADAQLRLHIEPDGTLTGVVGGYIDWREMGAPGSSYGEGLFNFSCPAVYGSFKKNADGMKDPVTGQCNGISMAYEIDGVPAFVTPDDPKRSQVEPVGSPRARVP